jgi:hypothetical protein
MTIPTSTLAAVLARALDDFFRNEVPSILEGVSERNNCQRLSIYLEQRAAAAGLKGYYADTEYNRKQGGRVKTILGAEMEIVVIQSDLILHSRGSSVSEDNLIAIEMKKSARPAKEKKNDRNRLRAMTKSSFDGVWSNDGSTHPEHVCGYRIGIYLELDAAKRSALIERYEGGEMCGTEFFAF